MDHPTADELAYRHLSICRPPRPGEAPDAWAKRVHLSQHAQRVAAHMVRAAAGDEAASYQLEVLRTAAPATLIQLATTSSIVDTMGADCG